MGNFALSDRSKNALKGVKPDMVKVVERAIQLSKVDFLVTEGLRTLKRQKELYAQGRTKPGKIVTWTLKSAHLDGKAVDLAPIKDGKIDWNDIKAFDEIYKAMHAAADELNVKIRSGCDWDSDGKLREKGEYDSPHHELA